VSFPLHDPRNGVNSVLVDSDDDEEDSPPPPKKTPAKTKGLEKQKETKVEASSYFSSTGKNKVHRTVPVRESRSKKAVVKPQPREEVNYLDDNDDDLADDIFAEAFQKKDDEYQEEHDEDMDGFIVPDNEDEDMKSKKRDSIAPVSANKKVPASASKKRKPVPEDDDEEGEEEEAPKKTSTKRPPAKKPRAPAKKKEEPEDNSEVKKILDAIPTVRPPTPPPREEGKKFNYREFAQRSAAVPASGGSKVIPTGADNCLAGLTFVFTGVLESISREEGQQLVKKYGGKVTTAPSKKTSYVVLGNDAGPKKLETIRAQGIKTINEDGLFQLIKSLPPNGGDSKAAKEYEAKRALEEKKMKAAATEMQKAAEADAKVAEAKGKVSQDVGQLWTTKYAPTKIADICGNKGQVEKLQKWLKSWPKNLKLGFKVRGADGNGVYRAVMIHGPPGIGKTTAAHLVATLEGYDVLEYNASDTRSKKLMEETMRGVLDNTSLKGYFAPDKEKVAASKKKMVLIMDEVDGMSAGDRGGVGQLAALCRKTSVSGLSKARFVLYSQL
jgi:replication factor C subunit 1